MGVLPATDRRVVRAAGWCGVAFSALSLVVIPLVAAPPTAPPSLASDAATVATWYAAHRTGFLVGNWLGVAAFAPGLVQLALLSAQVRAREGDGAWLGALVLAAGTFGYAVLACSLAVFQALPFLAGGGAAGMAGVGTLGAAWFALDGLAALPLLVAVGVASRATDLFPRWFEAATWATAALATGMATGALLDRPEWLAGGGPITMVGFVAFFAWTFALSWVQLRSAR